MARVLSEATRKKLHEAAIRGGKARAKKLSPKRRSEIASLGGKAVKAIREENAAGAKPWSW